MIENVSVPFENSSIPAFYTEPELGTKHPAILLVHEIWGLTDHMKEVAHRFMQKGYAVLVPDLLSDVDISKEVSADVFEDFKDPNKKDETQKKMRDLFAPVHSPEFAQRTVAKLQACFDYLMTHETINKNVAVVGFCFGGTYAFALAAEQPQLKAAVPFYGHAPEGEKLQMITCPILAFYGGKDTALASKIPELNETMALLHKKFQAVEYPDVGHAFFNDTNPNLYNKEAADDAWERMLEFLKENLDETSQ